MGPRRLGLFLCLAAVLALAASFARPATAQTYNTSQPANCSSIGGACPANAPCCRDGYCDSSAYFCGVNCEPLNSFSLRSCFARFPCYSYRDDFDGNKTRLVNAADWDGNPLSAEWISLFQPDNAYLNNSKLVLRVLKKKELNSYGRPEGFGASVATSRWIEYGTVEARFRTAKGAGIVSAFITRGSDGAPSTVEDEIDYEAVGKNLKGIYSNYFSYGDLSFAHGDTQDFTDDTSKAFHNYKITWMPDYIQWAVDGRIMRTVYKNQTWNEGCKCFKYPMREARIALSIWDGGMGAQGTAEWAGGPTDWSKDDNPDYTMEVDWVDIQCYYKGNNSQVFVDAVKPSSASVTRTKSYVSATYVNGGRLGPGMNGTNGVLTLVMPGSAAGLHVGLGVKVLSGLLLLVGAVLLA